MTLSRVLIPPTKRDVPGSIQGFTLIELMIVMLVIGVFTTLMFVSPSQVGYEDIIEEESRRLATLMELALEEAILETKELGVALNEKEYAFFSLENGQWTPISKDAIFRPRKLPEPLAMTLLLEGELVSELGLQGDTETVTPQIYILSSGELTPFEITMGIENSDFAFLITGDFLGNITADVKRTNEDR